MTIVTIVEIENVRVLFVAIPKRVCYVVSCERRRRR